MRFLLAVRAFFRTLSSAAAAARVQAALDSLAPPAPAGASSQAKVEAPKPEKPAAPARAARSEAVTLLAALQREARFIDLVKEPLDSYADAQIGAAARDVLRNCSKVIDRFFAVEPLVAGEEGSPLDLPPGFEAEMYQLSGNIQGQAPFHGVLTHHGWRATRSDLPTWNGGKAGASVIAAAEVEVK